MLQLRHFVLLVFKRFFIIVVVATFCNFVTGLISPFGETKFEANNPKQDNGFECGVFMLKGIESWVRRIRLHFSKVRIFELSACV